MKPFTLIVVFAFIFSCKDSKRPSYSNKKIDSSTETQKHSGKKLMETNCYVCHSVTAGEDNRIAPPMIAIKKRYSVGNITKETFINSMQNWIKNPTEENAKMFGAVKRFGVMPKQSFPEETIKQIADYMFEFEIEKPVWFDEHYNEQHGYGNGKDNGKGNGKGKGMGMGKQNNKQ